MPIIESKDENLKGRNYTIKVWVHKEFVSLSNSTDRNISDLINEALENYLKELSKKK